MNVPVEVSSEAGRSRGSPSKIEVVDLKVTDSVTSVKAGAVFGLGDMLSVALGKAASRIEVTPNNTLERTVTRGAGRAAAAAEHCASAARWTSFRAATQLRR